MATGGFYRRGTFQGRAAERRSPHPGAISYRTLNRLVRRAFRKADLEPEGFSSTQTWRNSAHSLRGAPDYPNRMARRPFEQTLYITFQTGLVRG